MLKKRFLLFSPAAFRAGGKKDVPWLGVPVKGVFQAKLPLRFRQQDTGVSGQGCKLLDRAWQGDFRRKRTPRLLRGLPRNALPPLSAFPRSGSEVSVGAMRDQGDDTSGAKLRTFFDRPFQAIELENGESESKLKRRAGGDLLSQFEFDTLVGNCRKARTSHDTFGRHMEFLPDSGAENASQMMGVAAEDKGSFAVYLVGDPAAAGHEMVLAWIACCSAPLGCADETSGPTSFIVAGYASFVLELGLAEDIFDLAQQAAGLRFVIHARRTLQLQQQFALTLGQLARGLYPHFDKQIPLTTAI